MSSKKKNNKEEKVKKAPPVEEAAAEVSGGPGEDGNEKDALIQKLTEERDNYIDLAQRSRAEFDNYRRRSEQQRLESVSDGVREAICALLPVIDNMERAVASASADGNFDALKEGVEMVYKQLLDTLCNLGTEEIKAQDEVFDPNLHHAVLQGEACDDHACDTVMEVLQKGYCVRDKIVRHAMVKVAK